MPFELVISRTFSNYDKRMKQIKEAELIQMYQTEVLLRVGNASNI